MKKITFWAMLLLPFLAVAQEFNTRYYFAKTFTTGQTDTLYFAFPPLGGPWLPYDSTTGFNFTTKLLANDYRWSGAFAISVRLRSGTAADSAKLAVATVGKGASSIGVEQNSLTYVAGGASSFHATMLNGSFQVFTVTELLDPSAAIAIIPTLGDLAGGARRIEFEIRYRRP